MQLKPNETLTSTILLNNSQQLKSQQSFSEPSLIQKTTFMVDSVTNLLCHQIYSGQLIIQEQQSQLPIVRVQVQEYVKPQIDLQEHKKKIRKYMRQNKSLISRINNRSISLFQSIKKAEQSQQKRKKQERQKTIQKRRQAIEQRLKSKSQMMVKIKKSVEQTNQKVKNVRKKKFLYQQKQEKFQSQFLLPKLEEQRKILKNRKARMKSIDIDELVRHQKTYYLKKAEHQTNRTLTSRFLETSHSYNPPSFVSKAYLISQAEENMKKQYSDLRAREVQINRIKQKQFVKAVEQKHKMQNQMSRLNPIVQVPVISEKKEKQKQKVKQLSRQAKNNLGNQYMKNLLYELRKIKKRQSSNTIQISMNKDTSPKNQTKDHYDIQIIKQERIQKIHKFRSKRIDSIFNDKSIHPIQKYQKLKNEVQKLQMILKLKKDSSQDINQRTQAADAYLDIIKTKLKLLDVLQK